MKKILIALLAMATFASADNFVVGADLAYGLVDTDTSVNGTSVKQDTETTGVRIKGGYDFTDFRVLGYVQYEDYADDIVLTTEKSNLSYGLEVDYKLNLSNNLKGYVGVAVGLGTKDLGSNDYASSVDYDEIALRAGILYNQFEAGIEAKRRSLDSVTNSGITIQEDDEIIGFYIGMNFDI